MKLSFFWQCSRIHWQPLWNYRWWLWPGFSRCFIWVPGMDLFRVPRIENRVPRNRENYHRVPTGPYRVPNIFRKTNPDYDSNDDECGQRTLK